jgi:hypothetical protein
LGGSCGGDTRALTEVLLGQHDKLLETIGLEVFQMVNGDGSSRNFGFMTVVDASAASDVTSRTWLNTEGELMRVSPAKAIVAPAMHGANIGSDKRRFGSYASAAGGDTSLSKEVFVEYFDHSMQRYPVLVNPSYINDIVLKCLEGERGQAALVMASEQGVENKVNLIAQSFRREFGEDFNKLQLYMLEFNRVMELIIAAMQSHFGVQIQNSISRKRHQEGRPDAVADPNELAAAVNSCVEQTMGSAASAGQAAMSVDNVMPNPTMVTNAPTASHFISQINSNPIGQHMYTQHPGVQGQQSFVPMQHPPQQQMLQCPGYQR